MMMRKVILAGALLAVLTGLSACGKSSGVFGRSRPDEFAVSRAAPLVVPPDFALTPPTPGAPRPQEADSSTQALQAMFGGPAARSSVETSTVGRAGGARSQAGIRSDAGDPGTNVVDKGAVTRDIIAAPEGAGQQATASTPK
jgi:Protein of unknown function (DUF3035)